MNDVTKKVEYWLNTDLIKDFTCYPGIAIDVQNILKIRFQYFDSQRWLYDESRLIPIDTHKPGDFSESNETKVNINFIFFSLL
jgi:hypothetical protein